MKFTRALLATPGFLLILLLVPPAEGGVILTTLASFGGTNGANPYAGLMQGADGNLYGTTVGGGTGTNGTVFRISPSSGTLVSLASFSSNNGAYPRAGLVQRTNDDFALYGTASSGGASNLGTIFRVTTNGELSAIASFRGTNGANPQAGLTPGNDGTFYGTTYEGGTNDWPNGYGVVFQVTTNGVLTPLLSFDIANGVAPQCTLRPASDGNFYGTTRFGDGYGTVFKISSGGVLTTVASFNSTNGAEPTGELVSGLDGKFYGTTLSGGTSNDGTVFQVTTNGLITALVSFNKINGANPFTGLFQCNDGNFYGTTLYGGTNDLGTVFHLTTNGVLTTLISFASTNGAYPRGGLIQGRDGCLYGTTERGGALDRGTVYRLSLPLGPIIQTVSQSGDTLTLSWDAMIGQTYQVQYKTNLNQITWSNWISLAATNATMTLFDTIGSDPQRFYRVVLLP